jgi:putative redox protein
MAMEMVVSFPGGACVEATCDDVVIRTDQPVLNGGLRSAPTPFELFLASMGTCAGIYVLGFCQQRGLPNEDIRIIQHVEMDPRTHLVREVKMTIQLPPDFPKKYETALVRAADLCTVKRHLEDPPLIKVETQIG